MSTATATKTEHSTLVSILHVIGWVLVSISTLIILYSLAASRMDSAAAAVSGVIGGIIFIALAEIIRALQAIEQHLRWRA